MKINGTLVFDASSASEIQNLRVQKFTASAMPVWGASDVGRLIYITDTNTLYKGGSAAWEAIATGGSAFSQAEGDAIETTLGSLISGSGAQQMSNLTFAAGATDLTTALNNLAATVVGHEMLYELGDVTLSSHTPTAGKFLMFNGTVAVDHTLVLADVSNVTASAAEVNVLTASGVTNGDLVKLHAVTATAANINILDGTTVTATELGYVHGVTSAIQTQLNAKQALNTGLTQLSSLLDGVGTGILVKTGVDTVSERALVAPAAGVTIANADGVLGNPTFALANDLAGLEGLATFGFAVRTADGVWATDALASGSPSRITITNGDGVAASPTIDLAGVTQDVTTSGKSFAKVLLDAYGRVIGNTPVVTADITALVDSTYVNVSGDTMTGNLTFSSGTVTGLPAPLGSTDAATKAYVDSVAAGLNAHGAVETATNGVALAATYANGSLGVGATLTANPAAALPIIGGYTLTTAGQRILVKDQADAKQNGIYVVTTLTSPWVLTRATDADNHIAGQVAHGDYVFISEGTLANTGWTEVDNGTGVGDAIILGTDQIAFTQFSGAGTYLAGVGLQLLGSTFSVQLGAGIVSLPSSEVGIDLFAPSTGALILTDNGTARATDTNSQLHLLLASAGGLTQDATGLYIPSAGVANAMLAHSSITLDVDSAGTGSIALGGTLSILGNSTQGISSSIVGSVITMTASDASASQKGVATFNTANFTVTTGDVTIKSAGVANAQLANPSFGISGTTGGVQQIALGTTLSVVGGSSPVTTVSAAGTLTINVAAATASTLGLASFNSAMFSVTAGAVSIASTLGTVGLSNVAAGVDTAANNDILVYSTGTSKWTNHTPATVAGTMLLGDLQDVGTAPATTAGKVLVADGSAWQAQSIYFLATIGSASTTWVVSHGLGQKYCNVTVVDSTDNVVIPQSIVFDSTTQLTVTFNTAITGAVVVMGVA